MTPVAFDTETWLIRPGRLAPPMVCLTSAIPVTGARLYHARPECMLDGPIWAMPRPRGQEGGSAQQHFDWIIRQDPIYGLNIAYDMCVCLAMWPEYFDAVFKAYDESRVVDVALSQKLIDIASGRMKYFDNLTPNGYSMLGLTSRILKKDRSADKDDDAWRMRYRELDQVPLPQWPQEPVRYALEDGEDTLAIAQHQWREHQSLLGDSPAQARAAFALQLMMCWGVMTDPVQIQKLRDCSEDLYWELSHELVKHGLVRGADAPKSKQWTRNVKAAQKRMYEIMRGSGRMVKLTDTGYAKLQAARKALGNNVAPTDVFTEDELQKYTSVDEDACKESGDDVLADYTKRTQLHGIVNTHVPDLLKGVVTPIQPRYNTLVESGRTSCRKGSKKRKKKDQNKPRPQNGYQFQNPKKAMDYFPPNVGIRECFISRAGTLFADPDFTGLELHTGAQACLKTVGYSRLADALNNGIDPHLLFGAELMGIGYEDARANRHDKKVKYYRQLAKVPNFGAPGGLGPQGLVGYARGYGVKLTLTEAKDLLDAWFRAWPEWNDYFKFIRDHIDPVSGRGQIKQLFVNRVRGGVTYTSACNTLFQGLGADGAKHAMFEVAKRCYVRELGSVLYGARPVGFVHDEILAEVFEEIAHEQATEMAQVMVDACNIFLPDVPVRCEPALCKRWTKDAEAIYSREGRLLPYDLARDGRWEAYWDDQAGERVKWAA